MLKILPAPQDIPRQFQKLKKALVDTSSILYMGKIGILENLASVLKLATIPEVLKECGPSAPLNHLEVLNFYRSTLTSTDNRLLAVVKQLQLPVISEDKRIIKRTIEEGLDCYNSLMMLNYLIYRKKISKTDFEIAGEKLMEIARYSEDVWEYGRSLSRVLLNT
jgi:hypothetical protein